MEAELCAVNVMLFLGRACKRCNKKSQPCAPYLHINNIPKLPIML